MPQYVLLDNEYNDVILHFFTETDHQVLHQRFKADMQEDGNYEDAAPAFCRWLMSQPDVRPVSTISIYMYGSDKKSNMEVEV